MNQYMIGWYLVACFSPEKLHLIHASVRVRVHCSPFCGHSSLELLRLVFSFFQVFFVPEFKLLMLQKYIFYQSKLKFALSHIILGISSYLVFSETLSSLSPTVVEPLESIFKGWDSIKDWTVINVEKDIKTCTDKTASFHFSNIRTKTERPTLTP
jgi:hypothetical protein